MAMGLPGLLFSLLMLLSIVASTSYYGAAADSFEPGPDYVYNLIYDHKTDVKPCVRLLHSEGEVGCSSPEAGVVGSLYSIETEAEYLDFKAHVSATWTDLKGIVLAGHLFNKTILDGLHQTKAVVGIALLPSNATGYACGAGKTGFSPAEKYPNKKWGLHPDSLHEWNPCGSAWFMERLPFPVFALSEADGQDLLAKAKENKRLDTWPKWAAEFKAFMWGAGDSEICLRRGFCDPVGGQSVWGSFEEGVDKERDVILVMAQLDGNSIFQDLAIGAEAAGSGVTALLTAIHALAEQRKLEAQQGGAYVPPVAAKRQLVFGFWTGETFGYLGSRKFVEDIVSFECKSVGTADKGRVRCSDPWMNDLAFKNISLSRIYALIDLQQLGQLDAQDATVYVHREPTSKGTAELLATLSSVAGSDITVKPAFEPAFELPPSSLHSFLLANSSLPALLLSDFNSSYRNPYLQSRWDDWNNVRPESVCAAAGLVARTLYALAYDAPPPAGALQANCTLVSELLDCLVRNNTCDLKRELLGVVGAPNPPTGYAGLYRHDRAAYNLNALLVNQVLNRVLSPQYYMPEQLIVNCSTSTHCPAGQNMGCVSGVCRNSSVYFHDAAPLGISWDADWAKWEHSNALFLGAHQQPLWTEPTWDTPSLRVFKKEQFLMEVLALVFGVLEFGVALGFFWLARKSLVARFGASDESSSSSSSSDSSLSVPRT